MSRATRGNESRATTITSARVPVSSTCESWWLSIHVAGRDRPASLDAASVTSMNSVLKRLRILPTRGKRRVLWYFAVASVRGVIRTSCRYVRNDLNPTRISWVSNSGCSHAAKWPPLGSLL